MLDRDADAFALEKVDWSDCRPSPVLSFLFVPRLGFGFVATILDRPGDLQSHPAQLPQESPQRLR